MELPLLQWAEPSQHSVEEPVVFRLLFECCKNMSRSHWPTLQGMMQAGAVHNRPKEEGIPLFGLKKRHTEHVHLWLWRLPNSLFPMGVPGLSNTRTIL